MRVFRGIALIGLLALAGCATISAPTAQQQAQAQQADAQYDGGHFAAAAQAYADLAMGNTGASDYFMLRSADAWRQAGSEDRANAALQQVDRRRLQPDDARRYDLLRAEMAQAHGNPTLALQLTNGPLSAYPPRLRLRVLELRAQALAQTGDTWGAADARATFDAQLQGPAQMQNRQQIVKLLTAMGADALQQQAAGLARDDPMHRWVNVALEQLGVPVARPMPSLDHPVGTVMPGAQGGQGYHMPQRVALLLPTSGDLSAAGNAVREGFFTAYFDGAQDGSRPDVTVYDSGGTPAQTTAAYQRAVAAGAQLVVGPLTRDNVSALLAGNGLPVPLLALNRPDGNALPPPNVTEFALLPETEGAQAAEHMHDLGLANAVVIVSTEDFAQRAAGAFQVQFKALGGHVVQTLSLDPATIDYAGQIKTLDVGANAVGGGVFMSMRPRQARLLMPQLRLAGLQLPVFATSHVYAGSDDPDSNGDLDGIEFCDAPWLLDGQPGLPSRSQVAASLSSARGTSARLFAFGMDAWALVPYLDWLREHPESYLPGASGQLAEDDFGRVSRVLAWARFTNGIARPVSGSLELGTPTEQTLQPPAPAASVPPPPAAQPIQQQQPRR